jgi:hypothetical protein
MMMKRKTYICVYIVVLKKLIILIYRSAVMNVPPIFATTVIGAMNTKPTTKYGFVIGAMGFIVVTVTIWINVMIVIKYFVPPVPHCYRVNFVAVVYVKIVLPLVDGTLSHTSRHVRLEIRFNKVIS